MQEIWSSTENTKHATSLHIFDLPQAFIVTSFGDLFSKGRPGTVEHALLAQHGAEHPRNACDAGLVLGERLFQELSWNNYVYTQSLVRLITKNLGWSLKPSLSTWSLFDPCFLPLTAQHAVLERKSRSFVWSCTGQPRTFLKPEACLTPWCSGHSATWISTLAGRLNHDVARQVLGQVLLHLGNNMHTSAMNNPSPRPGCSYSQHKSLELQSWIKWYRMIGVIYAQNLGRKKPCMRKLRQITNIHHSSWLILYLVQKDSQHSSSTS